MKVIHKNQIAEVCIITYDKTGTNTDCAISSSGVRACLSRFGHTFKHPIKLEAFLHF